MAKISSAKVITSLLWRFAERVGAEGVTLIVTILLARILEPTAYGTVAIVTSFTAILSIFVTGGFGNALVQKQNADEHDFSTVFFFNMAFGIVLYLLVFMLAPAISQYYKMPELSALIRVSGISIIISSVKNILHAYVARNMLFKRFFFATLGGTIGAAIIGIWMAYAGYGAWALVAQSLFNLTMDTIILWVTIKWRPKKSFSFTRLRPLFSYGWKLMLSTLLGTAYGKICQLMIGKVYTADNLAYYNKGENFPSLVASNITDAINSVLFPALSAQQDDKERLYEITRRFVKVSTFVMIPFMAGLAVCAEPLVCLLLTDKWLPSVPFLRLFCVAYALWPINAANLNYIKAIGRSDTYLTLTVIKSIIKLAIIALSIRFGVIFVAVAYTIGSIVECIINTIPIGKNMKYGCFKQFNDMLPNIMLSAIMALVVYGVGRIQMPLLLSLPLQCVAGIVTYLSCAKFTKNESFEYCMTILRTRLKQRV